MRIDELSNQFYAKLSKAAIWGQSDNLLQVSACLADQAEKYKIYLSGIVFGSLGGFCDQYEEVKDNNLLQAQLLKAILEDKDFLSANGKQYNLQVAKEAVHEYKDFYAVFDRALENKFHEHRSNQNALLIHNTRPIFNALCHFAALRHIVFLTREDESETLKRWAINEINQLLKKHEGVALSIRSENALDVLLGRRVLTALKDYIKKFIIKTFHMLKQAFNRVRSERPKTSERLYFALFLFFNGAYSSLIFLYLQRWLYNPERNNIYDGVISGLLKGGRVALYVEFLPLVMVTSLFKYLKSLYKFLKYSLLSFVNERCFRLIEAILLPVEIVLIYSFLAMCPTLLYGGYNNLIAFRRAINYVTCGTILLIGGFEISIDVAYRVKSLARDLYHWFFPNAPTDGDVLPEAEENAAEPLSQSKKTGLLLPVDSKNALAGILMRSISAHKDRLPLIQKELVDLRAQSQLYNLSQFDISIISEAMSNISKDNMSVGQKNLFDIVESYKSSTQFRASDETIGNRPPSFCQMYENSSARSSSSQDLRRGNGRLSRLTSSSALRH